MLEKHWPDVPRWRDIRTLTGDGLYERTGLRTVDVISGGFPCQPFSLAGKRNGKDDDRYLWPEMLRVIREISPAWVIGENVPGIINLALDQVLSDLEGEGYESQAFVIPACGVDAPHKRERVAIVAHAIDGGGAMRRHREFAAASKAGACGQTERRGSEESEQRRGWEHESSVARMADGLRTAVHTTDTDSVRQRIPRGFEREIFRGGALQTQALRTARTHSAWENWPDESGIPRICDGVPDRLDRIRALGNAVVPQQFYPFFKAIYDIQEAENHD